jgi:hypothetical protein
MATQTRTKFDALVADAAKVWREAAAIGLRPSIGFVGVPSQSNWQRVALNRKLSIKGFISEAIRNAHSTPEAITDLKRILESDKSALPASRTFIGRATHADIANLASPTIQEPPTSPGNSTMRRWMRDLPGLEAELTHVGHSVMELLVVSIEEVGRLRPEGFGPWNSLQDRQQHLDALRVRLQSMLDKIPGAFTPDDIEDFQEGKDAPVVTTFKISKGAVALAPRWDQAERLIAWAAKQEDL